MRTGTLILGATSVGIAYALSHEDCVIVEKGMNLCVDYTDCMNIQPVNLAALPAYTPETREIYRRAKEKNIIGADGSLHPFPLIGITAAALLEKEVPVLSFCETVRMERQETGFAVQLYCVSGYMEILARRIIDATPGGNAAFAAAFGAQAYDADVKRAIAASVRGKGASGGFAIPAARHGIHGIGDARMIKGCFDDEYYLELSVAPCDGYPMALESLHRLWQGLAADPSYAGFEFIDAAAELIVKTAEFSFTEAAPDAYRLIPATQKDFFFNFSHAETCE